MTLDDFWKTIDQTRQASGKLTDMPTRLIDILAQMEEREIIDYAEHFRSCLHLAYDANLWLGAVVIFNGCGDDKFSDFRCWLIAQGRETFEAALADPDSMAGLEKFDGDHGYPILFGMGSVAQKAFCRRATGDERDSAAEARFEELFPFRKRPPLKNEKLINKSEDEAGSMLPRLAARFPKPKYKSCFDEDVA